MWVKCYLFFLDFVMSIFFFIKTIKALVWKQVYFIAQVVEMSSF